MYYSVDDRRLKNGGGNFASAAPPVNSKLRITRNEASGPTFGLNVVALLVMDTESFTEDSELHVIVPQNTKVGAEDLFTHDNPKDDNVEPKSLLGVLERSLLHFGLSFQFNLQLPSSYSFSGTPR